MDFLDLFFPRRKPQLLPLESIFRLPMPFLEETSDEAVEAHIEMMRLRMSTPPALSITKISNGDLLIYTYDAKKYLEEGDWDAALLGNAPIIVNTVTGDVFSGVTYESIKTFIAKHFKDNV